MTDTPMTAVEARDAARIAEIVIEADTGGTSRHVWIGTIERLIPLANAYADLLDQSIMHNTPPGYVMVLEEPTEAMTAAATAALHLFPKERRRVVANAVYRAMLSAAPKNGEG